MPLGYDLYHRLDRFDVKNNVTDNCHSSIKPYKRNYWIDLGLYPPTGDDNKVDSAFKIYLHVDNPEIGPSDDIHLRNQKPFLNQFYNFRNSLYTYYSPSGYLLVNPILGLSSGSDFSGKKMLYTDTRGAELRGKIGDKLGFYSQITDNQTRVPDYMQ